MPKTFNLYEAKTHLSKLVERAASGEEIIIAKAGTPRARLVPLADTPRQAGGWEGEAWIADDFDVPLAPSIQSGFEGENSDRGADAEEG